MGEEIFLDAILDLDNTTIHSYGYHSSGPEGKDIFYGDLHEIKNIEGEPIEELLLTHRYLGGSDYSGSMVEKSNHDAFLEMFGDQAGVFDVSGGHGTFDVAISIEYLLNPINEKIALEMLDVLKHLNDYPVIDEDLMSNMENDAFYESFNDWGYKDAMSALEKKFKFDLYDYDEEKFKEMLLESDRNGNPSWQIEEGGGVYIDIDQMIKPITFTMLRTVLTDWEPKCVLYVYDNGGETADRYSIYIDEKHDREGKFYMVLSLSDNCYMPNGVNMWASGQIGPHNGKEIQFSELPKQVQTCAKNRLMEEH